MSDRYLMEALRRLLMNAPTTLSEVKDCKLCYHGTINVGTSIDPEPGPCPACGCELHREPHEDCFRYAQRMYDAALKEQSDAEGEYERQQMGSGR